MAVLLLYSRRSDPAVNEGGWTERTKMPISFHSSGGLSIDKTERRHRINWNGAFCSEKKGWCKHPGEIANDYHSLRLDNTTPRTVFQLMNWSNLFCMPVLDGQFRFSHGSYVVMFRLLCPSLYLSLLKICVILEKILNWKRA